MEVEVNIQECQSSPECLIDDRTWVNWFLVWLETMQGDLPAAWGYELSLRLTSDAEIMLLNGEYRDRPQPTDVLAFACLEVDFPPFSDIQQLDLLYLGDIVISVETAERQAREDGHSLCEEVAWLATHGFLHLLGWDHPDSDRLQQMLKQQEILLQKVGIISQSWRKMLEGEEAIHAAHTLRECASINRDKGPP